MIPQNPAITEGKHLSQNQTNPRWLNRKIDHEYENNICRPNKQWRRWIEYIFLL